MFYNDLPVGILPDILGLGQHPWQITREMGTGSGTLARSKMRIYEKYALMVLQAEHRVAILSEKEVFDKAMQLFNSESKKNPAEQVVGNFLQRLLDQATTFIRARGLTVSATDKVEDVFKHFAGTEANVLSKVQAEGCAELFTAMLANMRTYCSENYIDLFDASSGAPHVDATMMLFAKPKTASDRRNAFLTSFDARQATSTFATELSHSTTEKSGDAAAGTDLKTGTDDAYPKQRLS